MTGKKIILDQTLTDIADAIRAKTGDSDLITPLKMPEKIGSIPEGGNLDEFIDGNVVDVETDATYIKAYAFAGMQSLETIYCPHAVNGGSYMTKDSTFVKSVDMPMYTNDNSACMSMLSGLQNLVSINFPELIIVPQDFVSYCRELTDKLSFTHAKQILGSAFRNTGLEELDFGHNLTTVPSSYGAGSIGINAFTSCSKLTALILRSRDYMWVAPYDPLSGTPIANGTGYIYVPQALLTSYQAATNWSTYASQFRAIEDYTVDGTTTGALDPAKI